MQVKKFEAPTIQEALETIKRELGPEAIVLKTKQHRRGFGLLSKPSVEVTAAISEKTLVQKKSVDKKLPKTYLEKFQKQSARNQAYAYGKYLDKHLEKSVESTEDKVNLSDSGRKKLTATRYIDIPDERHPEKRELGRSSPPPPPTMANERRRDALEEELRSLRKQVHELRDQRPSEGSREDSRVFKSDEIMEVFELLLLCGIDRRQAHILIKEAMFEYGENVPSADDLMDWVTEILLKKIETSSVQPKEGKREIVALLGPTGVGKTTTAAKLAGKFRNQGKKVAMISVIGANPHLAQPFETYTKVLSCPYRKVLDREELKVALQEFSSFDMVIMDFEGVSQRDGETIQKFSSILSESDQARRLLVMSANTREEEQLDIGKRFSVLHPESLVVTKLDESTMYGGIYNVSQKLKMPIGYFSLGRKVPSDLEEASSERLVSLILDIQ